MPRVCISPINYDFLFFFQVVLLDLGLSLWIGTMLVLDQVLENGTEHAELLPATNDNHGGVIVDMEEAMDSEVFVTSLRASISRWRQQVVILIRRCIT